MQPDILIGPNNFYYYYFFLPLFFLSFFLQNANAAKLIALNAPFPLSLQTGEKDYFDLLDPPPTSPTLAIFEIYICRKSKKKKRKKKEKKRKINLYARKNDLLYSSRSPR
jgi:hypothetical protein